MCGAWAAHGVKGVESAIDATEAEGAAEHLGGEAEERVEQEAIRIAEAGLVEEVEEFGAELEFDPFGESEAAAGGQVDLVQRKTAKSITAEATIAHLIGGDGEGGAIENAAAGIAGASEGKGLAG